MTGVQTCVSDLVYLAALQIPEFLGNGESSLGTHMTYLTLVVRTVGDPAGLSSAIERTVWSFDPSVPISAVLTMDRAVADTTAQPRFEMLLLGMFAAIALLLAAVGIYGVIAYSVNQRTSEFGLRVALGAQRADVLHLVLMQATRLVLAGTIIGIILALTLTRVMKGLIFNVGPTDPLTFVTVGLIVNVIAVIACYVPARKATKANPMIALRAE